MNPTAALPNPFVRTVSACFPCYNDAESIGKMVRDVRAALWRLVDELEIIVTNDGSNDNSREVLQSLQAEIPELRVVHHEVNRGYGGALLSCFGAATKEWIFYTDGDAQYDAAEVADLIAHVNVTTDIVQGYKVGRGDRWYRKAIGRSYHHAVKVLFSLHVRDTDCDFRLFRRSLLERAPLQATTGVICVEMMRSFQTIGAVFVEVPVHHYDRPHGRSQFFRLPQVSRAAMGLARLWWRMMVRRSR
jgi:glycosyltransferase involved in cell wall biosynthesis